MTPEDMAMAKVRVLAKKFANDCRSTNMAHKLPDDVLDKVPDKYIELFKATINAKNVYMRPDGYWEERRG